MQHYKVTEQEPISKFESDLTFQLLKADLMALKF